MDDSSKEGGGVQFWDKISPSCMYGIEIPIVAEVHSYIPELLISRNVILLSFKKFNMCVRNILLAGYTRNE